MKKPKLVFFARESLNTNILYWHLYETFDVKSVIIETKESRLKFLLRRLKKLSFFTVIGQLFFVVFIYNSLKFLSKFRLNEILTNGKFKSDKIPQNKILNVKSINEISVIKALSNINPDFILVNGTRIISKKTLEKINIKIINLHLGITPNYRGSHSSYWALLNNDLKNIGFTFHLVDQGIDTGNILLQKTVNFKKHDNISTYSLVLFTQAMLVIKDLIWSVHINSSKIISRENYESNLYYHPTFFNYIFNWLFFKIK